MQSNELPAFAAQITKHYELYPRAQMSQATVAAWFDELEALPIDSVIAGLEKSRTTAHDHDDMPTCSKVKALANMHAQMAFDAHRRSKLLAAKAEAEGCTLKADSPWMQLAAYWEQENDHWQNHPGSRPEDPGVKRWPQFWAMWNKTAGDGKAVKR